MIPQDPIILLSYTNTKLRDRDPDLDTFCRKEDVERAKLCAKLEEAGYCYDAARNQFLPQ